MLNEPDSLTAPATGEFSSNTDVMPQAMAQRLQQERYFDVEETDINMRGS